MGADINDHRMVTTETEPITCPKCGARFDDEDTLNVHQQLGFCDLLNFLIKKQNQGTHDA